MGMKDFFRKYGVQVALVAIILLFVIFNFVSTCNSKHAAKTLTQTELNDALAHQRDSITSANLQLENVKIDSTRSVEARKTKTAEQAAQIHAGTANKFKSKANKLQSELDSLKAINAPCEQQLTKCEETSDNLYKVIAQNDSTIEDIGREAEGYSRQLYLCDSQRKNDSILIQSKISLISETDRINGQLRKELQRKNSWFERNKLWIGVVVGVVGTVLVVK